MYFKGNNTVLVHVILGGPVKNYMKTIAVRSFRQFQSGKSEYNLMWQIQRKVYPRRKCDILNIRELHYPTSPFLRRSLMNLPAVPLILQWVQERMAYIYWLVRTRESSSVRNLGSCSGGLQEMDVIGTHLQVLKTAGLTRGSMTVIMKAVQ